MVKVRRSLIVLIAGVLLANASSAFCDDGKVIAYYFHGNFRCATCRNLEQYARESIENNFKEDLADGGLVFMAVNIEEEGNGHFVSDYQLYTKSLVLSLVRDGKEVRHKNLDKIWEYVRNKTEYMEYVRSEVDDFLKGVE